MLQHLRRYFCTLITKVCEGVHERDFMKLVEMETPDLDHKMEAKMQEDFEREKEALAKQFLESGDPEVIKIGEQIRNFTGVEDFETILTSLVEFNQKYEKNQAKNPD